MNKIFVPLLLIFLTVMLSAYIVKKTNAAKRFVTLRFFKLSEFDSPAIASKDSEETLYEKNGRSYIKGSGAKNMNLKFLYMLDKARAIVERDWNKIYPDKKVVFRIDSGYRTQHYNDSLPNSVENSEHVDGEAADIIIGDYSDEQRKAIVKALVEAGFKRFGFSSSDVHVDSSNTKPSPAVWDYGTGSIEIDPFSLASN